jgi:soluble lytic murein transglycosylase-like protein
MDQAYWLTRERNAIANARAATFADVQLIHYGLAHRYSIEAAKAVSGRPKLKTDLGEQLKTAFHPSRSPVVV